MIEVFTTNIPDHTQAKQIIRSLKAYFPDLRIPCDKETSIKNILAIIAIYGWKEPQNTRSATKPQSI